jgi:hypothetical protein
LSYAISQIGKDEWFDFRLIAFSLAIQIGADDIHCNITVVIRLWCPHHAFIHSALILQLISTAILPFRFVQWCCE